MLIIYNHGFKKALEKLPPKIKITFKERLDLFIVNPYAEVLNNHRLHGQFRHYRSINITSNYRLIFEEKDSNTISLIDIGTHNQIYG